MVLESLVGPKDAERKPLNLFYIGILYAVIALFLSIWVFREQASLIFVFLTSLTAVPLLYKTIIYEESKDSRIKKEIPLLKEHSRALSFFIALFLGFTITFSLAYVFLPSDLIQNLFSTQTQTIRQINSQITGGIINPYLIIPILSNNLKVLFFCIFFSFFYGAGAIFILTWNASVIGTAIGTFIRNNIADYATHIGLFKIGSYFHVFSLGLLRYLIHGTPEILAYFAGGLGGGIISVAVIKYNTDSKQFKHVLLDSIDLILIAVLLLIVASLLEVFVTPLLF